MKHNNISYQYMYLTSVYFANYISHAKMRSDKDCEPKALNRRAT